ncbi:MAG: GrxC family glutaredoxin [Urechidicola sp.]|jgi:GrxC family glutaredoxin
MQFGDSKMPHIEIYTKDYCPFCFRAKALLDHLDVDYTDYEVTFTHDKEIEMNKRSGRFTVPQIFIDNKPIGGSDELYQLVENGEFFGLLNSSQQQSTLAEGSKHV